MTRMTYDEACSAATTRQGLDPVTARLTAEGFPVAVEQTGGFCMVASVTFGGRTYCVTRDGVDETRPYLLGAYDEAAWHDGGEELFNRSDQTLDEIVTALREAQSADDFNPRAEALRLGTVLGQFEDHEDTCEFATGASATCTCGTAS